MNDARDPWLTKDVRLVALAAWAAAQCAGVYSFYRFFIENGYLPAPFVYDKADTFMDFFHTLYWASSPGRYTEWMSVYPPLNFLGLQAAGFLLGAPAASDGFDLRENGVAFVWLLIACYLALPALMLKARCWASFTWPEKALLYIITVTSTPLLFALERGNLLIFALPLVSWLISARGTMQSLAFALLVNLKPYFALLGGAFLGDPKAAFRCVFLSVLLFSATGLVLDEHFLQLLRNLLGFSQSDDLFSLREVMSLPTSIGAFAVVLRGVDVSRPFMGLALTFGDVASLLDLARVGLVLLSILALVCIPSADPQTKLALAIVLIPNIGVSTGGYSIAFLIPILPVLLRLQARSLYVLLVVMCMLPLDVFSLLTEEIGSMDVFLSGEKLDVTWTLGIGSIARPCIAFVLLCVLLTELSLTSPAILNKRRKPETLYAHV